MFETILSLFFPFLVIYAAMSDLVSMTISNKISLLLMGGFMVFAIATGMSWEQIGWHWAMFGIVLVVGFTLFAFGVVGGGDAKLAAAVSLWFGWQHVIDFIYLSSILGAGLTFLFVYLRTKPIPHPKLAEINWIAHLYRKDVGIPYGIALGAGALMVYPVTPWMEMVFAAAAKS